MRSTGQGTKLVLALGCFGSNCPEMLPGRESLDDVRGGDW